MPNTEAGAEGSQFELWNQKAAPSHPQLWPPLYLCFSSPCLRSEREPCTWSHICWSDWASAVGPQGPASILLLPSTAPAHTEPPAESRWAQAGPVGLHSVLEHSTKPITSPAPGWMREMHSESCMWPWEVTDAAGHGGNSRALRPPWSVPGLYSHHRPSSGDDDSIPLHLSLRLRKWNKRLPQRAGVRTVNSVILITITVIWDPAWRRVNRQWI